MNKDVVIIGVNFYPEDASTGLYTTQMAEYLSENGFYVSVITGFPYYPQWKIWDSYSSKSSFYFEEYKGIKVYRYKQYVPSNPNLKNRVRHMLSFMFGSYLNLRKIRKAGLVIAVVPFTIDAWLALKLKEKLKSKLWIHIQDFELDAALQAGLMNRRKFGALVEKVITRWEQRLLRKADVISTISFTMLKKLEKKTGRQGFYFPNWVDTDFIDPLKAKQHRYMSSKKFEVLYSGNIGKKQDWSLFLEVVQRFKNFSDIEFVIVGDGANKNWLLKQIEKLPNVKYYPPVPYCELPDLLCSADLHILFQKSKIIDSVMPSKLLGMMASAKPSVVVGHLKSEIYKIFKDSKGGVFVSSYNPEDIVIKILELKKNKFMRELMGKSARQYVLQNFSKEKVLNRFLRQLEIVLKKEE